jgi:Rab-like protein 3
VGDSGVGKSSLVHLICNQDEKYSMKRSTWTIGCSVDVKVIDFV